MSEDLIVERADGVAQLTLNRPDKLNALTADLIERVADEITSGGDRVVVITGAERAFTSGADLGRDRAAGPGDTLDAADKLITAMIEGDAIVITRVNGPAAGIGASIALAADLPVMSADAYLLLPFSNIGLMPDGAVTATWPATGGRVRAMRAALFADRIGADEALATGLIAAAVKADDLDAFVDDWVVRLVRRPRVALARAKQAINAAALPDLAGVLRREAEGQRDLMRAADFAEGTKAFLERREPRFTD